MTTSRYTEPQIRAIRRQAEGGMPGAALYRAQGISNASVYKWRAKYGGVDASMIAQTKAIEEQNRRLKKMFAELSVKNELLMEALGKKPGHLNAARWPRLRWSDAGSALPWPAGPLGSARPAIGMARSCRPRTKRSRICWSV